MYDTIFDDWFFLNLILIWKTKSRGFSVSKHLVTLVTVHTVVLWYVFPFSIYQFLVCDCRRSCMVVLRFRETCAVRSTLAEHRCCYYCASVYLIIMSNTYTVEKKSETKSNSHHSPSIRIQVELFEPTENRYPVFNYQKLFTEEVSLKYIL